MEEEQNAHDKNSCKELGIEFIELGDNIPLLEMEKQLIEIVTNLEKDKEERMKPVCALIAMKCSAVDWIESLLYFLKNGFLHLNSFEGSKIMLPI